MLARQDGEFMVRMRPRLTMKQAGSNKLTQKSRQEDAIMPQDFHGLSIERRDGIEIATQRGSSAFGPEEFQHGA